MPAWLVACGNKQTEGEQMARPCKRRRVCTEPSCRHFGPKDMDFGTEHIGTEALHSKAPEAIVMTLDEFECIRLIDLEGMTQEQCAFQINVARTTAQAIYSSARAKMAECLVNGRELLIGGGDYVLCDGKWEGCGCRRKREAICPAQNGASEKMYDLSGGKKNMKIAVTYEDGVIFQHFGHTEYFKVYDVEDGKVISSAVVSTNGSGHGALAGVLASLGVEVLICGGIGGGAQNALANAGIRLFGGASGDADQAVEAFLNGNLAYNPDVHCDHHGHGEHHGGECGHHTCG